MNKFLCFILLFFCQQSFSQSSDSINIQIKKLRTEREAVNASQVRLQKEEVFLNSKMQKLDDRYYAMLVNLDSLVGVSNSMENKSKKTKAEEQKLLNIKKQQDSLKTSLIAIEEQRLVLQDNRDHLKASIKSASMQLNQFDKQMQQLEKLRQ